MGKLGGRARQHKMGHRVSHRLNSASSVDQTQHLSESSVTIEELPAEETLARVAQPRTESDSGGRFLQQQSSDPKLADKKATDKIAKRTQALAHKEAWYHEDPMEAETVEFQIRTYH